MEITKEIFESFLVCPYKTHRLLKGESGTKSEYELLHQEIAAEYRQKAMAHLFVDYKNNSPGTTRVLKNSALTNGPKLAFHQKISAQGLSSFFYAIERIPAKSALGSFHYVPVLFTPNKKLTKEEKILSALDGLVLEGLQGRRPLYVRLISGEGFKTTKLKIENNFTTAKRVIDQIKLLAIKGLSAPTLNRHCQICEFKDSCRQRAIEKDDLSLLTGISAKEIEAQNKKGIFTVTQYSYSFRARRRFKKSYPFNLRALALREKKVHIYGTPAMPMAEVQIYLDVEGDPERNFYYLIGLVVVAGASEKHYAFWADNESEEQTIFVQFLNTIKKYSNFKFYHYGSYETKFLKKLQKDLAPEYTELAQKISEQFSNVLSVVYSNVFFPAYSNGLKDIASYLGFKWSSINASGIQSLVWRKQFEIAPQEMLKNKLIQYNLEDCLALKRVVEFIDRVANRTADEKSKRSSEIVYADDLKNESTYKWGMVNFVLEDLKHINNCAYFDYQREKVFFRTNPNIKRQNQLQEFKEKNRHRINQKIILQTQKKCPRCKNTMYRHGNYSMKVTDLKFSMQGGGIKRWVSTYRANRARCPDCKMVMIAKVFKDLQKYGHGLISWVIYQNIVGHTPFYRIRQLSHDLFGLTLGQGTLQRFKTKASQYYQAAYAGIISRIKKGSLVHIDETQVSLEGLAGYVWVFTSLEDVYFLYTPTREGGFLKTLLRRFKGVVISDFYGAYCSPEWLQQKCLIHLIRDLNDDLRKNPFDEEYKKIADTFSVLLRQIIGTIDKYGLKKRNLGKHKKGAAQFFRAILCQNYQSELAQKYQKRFLKNEHTLFTFLDYDGIPWNNNNAEHAIKHFAIYRRLMTACGKYTVRGLNQYLVLLSIYQTCRYRGINFLQFLTSKRKVLPLS